MRAPDSNTVAGQAAGLIRLHPHRPVRVIAVASGKGGVGKSTVSLNLALALIRQGQRVMLMDADLGLANIDVLLGLQPTYNLAHLMEGRVGLADILLEGPMGLKVVPAASGRQRMAELDRAQLVGLVQAFSEFSDDLDTLVVDTAAGISGSVVTLAQAAQEVVVVACNEPASITDAYALIKVLSRDYGIGRIQVVANAVRSAADGRQVFDHLCRVADRFLDVTLHFLGTVPHDEAVRRAVRQQRAVVEAYPGAPSSLAFDKIGEQVSGWQPPGGPRGNVEFFVERLLGRSPAAPALVGA
ncbi:MAG: MinD/ParA family protein [Salinisphaeraceae bacterium]|uniref:MinD/ParA family protein n=1 Tax=Spectribacter hydrogenoxidans TaxID=3075608 RepID=A0ABU3BVR3_9GAMM|nr:MinD/ParA family protein [Salinisphaera sp. W335]MDT0633367.1 MinD/ParA family protein [Salinisphaera sp. W335]